MKIQGSSVIITGAGSGMGLETARQLVAQGALVTLIDRNEQALEAVAKELKCFALPGDVTDEISINNALEKIEEKFGILQILINCAGIINGLRIVGKEKPFPLDEFKKVIDVNLVGTFNMMRLVAARMIAKHQPSTPTTLETSGVIINTASIAAYEGQIGQAAYSASKAGVVGLTLPAAREFAPWGIRVVTVAPGFMETPMLTGLPETIQHNLASQVTFPKRLGKPVEFAQLVMHIIENDYLNGETIRLDGAVRLQAK